MPSTNSASVSGSTPNTLGTPVVVFSRMKVQVAVKRQSAAAYTRSFVCGSTAMPSAFDGGPMNPMRAPVARLTFATPFVPSFIATYIVPSGWFTRPQPPALGEGVDFEKSVPCIGDLCTPQVETMQARSLELAFGDPRITVLCEGHAAQNAVGNAILIDVARQQFLYPADELLSEARPAEK